MSTSYPKSDKPFRFLDLPAELRDQIYENLTANIPSIPTSQTGDGRDTIRLSAECGPRLPLLLVNRKFSKGYTDCIKRLGVLHVTDWNKDFPDTVKLGGKGSLKIIKKADIKLLASCGNEMCNAHSDGSDFPENDLCYVHINVKRHLFWLKFLAADLTHLSECKLSIYIWGLSSTEKCVWPQNVAPHKFLAAWDQLAGLEFPGLEKIDVFVGQRPKKDEEVDFLGRELSWEQLEDVRLYGRWVKQEGWTSGNAA